MLITFREERADEDDLVASVILDYIRENYRTIVSNLKSENRRCFDKMIHLLYSAYKRTLWGAGIVDIKNMTDEEVSILPIEV